MKSKIKIVRSLAKLELESIKYYSFDSMIAIFWKKCE